MFYDAFVCNLFLGAQNFTLLVTKKFNYFKSVKPKTIVNIFWNFCQTFETKKLKKNQVFLWYGLLAGDVIIGGFHNLKDVVDPF
jgi:hypothetical protein